MSLLGFYGGGGAGGPGTCDVRGATMRAARHALPAKRTRALARARAGTLSHTMRQTFVTPQCAPSVMHFPPSAHARRGRAQSKVVTPNHTMRKTFVTPQRAPCAMHWRIRSWRAMPGVVRHTPVTKGLAHPVVLVMSGVARHTPSPQTL